MKKILFTKLKVAINRQAHAAALVFEDRIHARLTDEVLERIAAGESQESLTDLITMRDMTEQVSNFGL